MIRFDVQYFRRGVEMATKKEKQVMEQAMAMLAEVPGETLLERIRCLKGWYLQLQTEIEQLNKRDYIFNVNRNSFM